MLPILRDDALAPTDHGVAVRLCLPWIRSLPVSSVTALEVSIDAAPLDVVIVIDGRDVAPGELAAEDGWWFLQDRLTLHGRSMPAPGIHHVSVSFDLVIPYLPGGPDAPLTLPFHAEADLALTADHEDRRCPPSSESAAPAVRLREPIPDSGTHADPWPLSATAFNWTPDVIAAERPSTDIAVGIVEAGVAEIIELELGQLWRSFPDCADADSDAFRAELDAVGCSVSIVGASIDDWRTPTRRRDDDERLAFLVPQLRSARRIGARGVRLPIGQAGVPLLRRLQPLLEDLDLVLYEEVQGHQTPTNPAFAPAYETIAAFGDPRIRLLVDISMLMPALPVSYLELLCEAGLPESFVDRLADEWKDPATDTAVVELLREGAVPPHVRTAFMNLLVRFGRSDAADLRGILPYTGAFHLKFWDLDDADGRVSQPIRELGAELARTGFAGTLCSEWGGHEWLGEDPTDMTRRHLALARAALTT